MKYLGIDYGAKSVGLAVSDPTGVMAFPRETLPNNEKLIPAIVQLVEDARIGTIVVGDTRSFGGSANPITNEVEKFIEKLRADTGKPVETIWEAGSSIEASRFAPDNHQHDDAAAAAIILQRYLDTHS